MKTDRYGISGSTLKIIAAISMVLDHVSRIVLTNEIMTHASYNQISDEQWAILSEASDVLPCSWQNCISLILLFDS